jgi:hypothetical protein
MGSVHLVHNNHSTIISTYFKSLNLKKPWDIVMFGFYVLFAI